MMSKSAPWQGIQTPTIDFTVVRVPDTTGVPIYWGRDIASQCLLIIELTGDFLDQLRRDGVSLKGINVDIRMSDKPGQQRFVLTLARHVDSDLFAGLCDTLIESLREVSDSATALAVALAHLKRWKAFFAGRNARLLSSQEVSGLFSELYVLRQLYKDTLTQTSAIDGWCGPENSHQDFIFGNRAIEVKSLSGRERSTVRISSEDQLESLVEDLFLLILRLNDMPENNKALSLNEIVKQIEDELSDAEGIEQFADKLAGMGYVPLIEYDTPRFIVSAMQGYRVTSLFPKLVRSKVPQGITKVSYDIKLEAIEPFVCDEAEIFRRP